MTDLENAAIDLVLFMANHEGEYTIHCPERDVAERMCRKLTALELAARDTLPAWGDALFESCGNGN